MVSSEAISAIFDQLGVSDTEKAESVRRIAVGTVGLLLYGSRARDDFTPSSDFDLLRLSASPMSTFSAGRVSISSYTERQLRGASRTLFGTHLLRDAKVLIDPFGRMSEILSAIVPADPADLVQKVRDYSVVLNQPASETERKIAGLTRLARYLLRTAIYARAMVDGRPCFSVRELAVRFNDPALATILASDPCLTGPPSMATLTDLITRLEREIGPLRVNESSSLEELAIEMWDVDRNVAALAIRAAAEDHDRIDYSDLPKILL